MAEGRAPVEVVNLRGSNRVCRGRSPWCHPYSRLPRLQCGVLLLNTLDDGGLCALDESNRCRVDEP